VGFHIAEKLASENNNVVVIDRDAGALKRILEHLDVQTLEGSGGDAAVLAKAGIDDSDMLLAVTDSDEINIISCLIGASLSPNIFRLARLRRKEYVNKGDDYAEAVLKVDKIINPDEEVVKTIERFIEYPGVEELAEFAEGRIKLVGTRVSKSELLGKNLMEVRAIMHNFHFLIAAIVRGDNLIIPSGADVISEGDLVYFVCMEADIMKILKWFKGKLKPISDVLIIGGGDVGFRLAKNLEPYSVHVKIIEQEEARCELLATELNKTVVLFGDGTDKSILQEENIANMDLAVSITGDEETNILASLLAKNMGAKKAVTRIDKFAYFPLVKAIGIENTVSPRMSAVNSILRYMRKGKIIQALAIKNDEAEALEAIVEEHSKITGKRIIDLRLPRGSLILSIQRGEEIIFPTGDSVIEPQDRILILTLHRNVSRVEKALTVQLEQY
jgi:trk system potassium uptake protein TrkA